MSFFRAPFYPGLAAAFIGSAPLALCAQVVSVLQVEMLPVAQVQQSRVVLGEVAYLSSTDLQLLRRAVALPVGSAPRAGESTVLDQERLAGWVSLRLGVLPESIRWGGVSATVVKSATRELDGESLIAMAQAALLQNIQKAAMAKGFADAQVELTPVSLPTSVSVPIRDTEFRVRSLAGAVLGKRMLVWIDIFAGQRHVKAVPVRFEVSVFASAAVAVQQIRAGQGVDAYNTHMQSIDVASLLSRRGAEMLGPPAFSPATTRELNARNLLKTGEALTADRVQLATAVARGDRVTMVATSGLVSLESKVEVLQAGAVGQIVRVRPTNGNADLMAKVIAPGQLELQP